MTRALAWFFLAASVLSSPLARAQDGSFDSGGLELHYRSAGSGTPVVLLSGGPGLDVDYVLPVAEFLPAGHRSIAFEQRGTGRSRPPKFDAATLTMESVVADLDALRVHLQQERLILLGHSWGGMLAMSYAVAHPDRVDRLILVGSGGPTLEFTQWFNDNIEARLRPEDVEMREQWRAAAANGEDPAKVATGMLRAIVPGYFFDRKHGLEFRSALADGQHHPDVSQSLFGAMRVKYDLREGLKLLKRPVLIVQGHQDPIGDKTAEEIRASIAGSTLVYIRRCGHFPWIERPDEFRSAIATFLPARSK